MGLETGNYYKNAFYYFLSSFCLTASENCVSINYKIKKMEIKMENIIKLHEKNKEKINNWLDRVQKRCTARLLNFDQIIDQINQCENKIPLLKKDWHGLTIHISEPFGHKPSKYRGIPESTYIRICRKKASWYIYDIFRASSDTSAGYSFTKIKFTDEQKPLLAEYIRKNWHTV